MAEEADGVELASAEHAIAALRRGAAPESAAAALSRQLRQRPRPAWLNEAESLCRAGFAPVASSLLEQAQRRWPGDVQVRHSFGRALRMSGDLRRAESEFRAALDLHPYREDTAIALALTLRDRGRLKAAAAVLTELPDHPFPQLEPTALQRATLLLECGDYRGALDLCEWAALRTAGGSVNLRVLAGSAAQALGRFEEVRRHVLAALDLGAANGEWGGALLLLADAQRYTSDRHPDLDLFRRALDNAQLPLHSRAAAAFALGKAYDDLRDFERAASVLRRANGLASSERPWSATSWRSFVDRQTTRHWPAEAVPAGGGFVPVFIVGLPRSGTTLVAERLSRVPAVRNRGETNWIPYLDQQLAARGMENDARTLGEAARLYSVQLRQDDAPAHWYIDKNPLNFRHLGLIAAMLPQARVIHCVRDLRDTALSIWSRYFDGADCNFAYGFEHIAAFAAGESRLMEHWAQTLQLPIFTLRYERLTMEPQAVLTELAAFLGMPRITPIESSPRPDLPIATVSAWQARQPIYRTAVERWRNFAPYVPELEALGGQADCT